MRWTPVVVTGDAGGGPRPEPDREELVADLAVMALRDTDRYAVLAESSRVVSSALGVRLVAVLELTPSGDELVLRAGRGWPEVYKGRARVPIVGSRFVDRRLHGLRLPELGEPSSGDEAVPLRSSSVGAIIANDDEPVGAIVAYVEDADAFSERDGRFLDTVAGILGAVFDRAGAAAPADRPPRDAVPTDGSDDTFHRLFSASPDAIVLIDPHDPDVSWPIVDCNEAACRMNGYAREDLIGRSIDVLNLTPGTPEERRAYLARLRRKPVISLETHHRCRDGRVIPVEVSTSLVTLGDRELVLGIDRDISERKRAQEELRESYLALRRADQERSNLLARLVRAQEEERSRVANDIHDDSIQVLTAVGYRLAGLRQHVEPGAVEKVDLLSTTIEHAIFRLRHLLFELRPPALDRTGLAAALSEYIDRMTEDGAPTVTLDGELEGEPSPESRVLLYRIAQEALTNVRKHAKAERVTIHVGRDADGVLVRVVDDGVGFHPDDAPSTEVPGHIGLVSMRERAELAGGWFSIESEPGAGTTVSFWIPDHSRV